MRIKELLGRNETTKITLEAQAANTQFKSTFPSEEVDFNYWIAHIYKQLDPSICLPVKKKITVTVSEN